MESAALRRQLTDAADHLHLTIHTAMRELPASQHPLLLEINRLMDSITQECLTTPPISNTRRTITNESPRADVHPGNEASMYGGTYHEADFNESPAFRQEADLHEASSLAEEGIVEDAVEKGMYVEDAVATDDNEYIDALKTATGRAPGKPSGGGSDTGPYDANMLLEGESGRANQPLSEADLAPSSAISQDVAQAHAQLQQAWQQLQQQAQAYGGPVNTIAELIHGLGQFLDAHPQYCGQSREIDMQIKELLDRTRELLANVGGLLPALRKPI